MQNEDTPFEKPSQRPEPLRILVVDDVEENRILLEVILGKLNCTAVLCSSGGKAVEKCRQERFSMIFMDLQMPGMDGYEAIGRIRAEGLNSGTAIIAMTASGEKEDALRALESGCDDCLTKPVNRRVLEQKVNRSLAKQQQMREAEQGLAITSYLEGDPDYHKAIETFVVNLPGRIEAIRQALEQQDFKELAFNVHALKGVGGFAGFEVYAQKAAQLETSIQEEDFAKIQMRIDEMMQMCLQTKMPSDK